MNEQAIAIYTGSVSKFGFGAVENPNFETLPVYCICDEVIKSYGLSENPNCKMTSAEIMTFALISGLHYRAGYRTTRLVLSGLRYFPKILSHSHLVRRIHAIPEQMWYMVFFTC